MLETKDFVGKAVELFPRFYYYIPVLRPQKLRLVQPKRKRGGGNAIRFDAPMDGVLWMCETLAAERNKASCLQQDLRELVGWWYPHASISKEVGTLKELGLVKQVSEPRDDERYKSIKLTALGKRRLNRIKAERYKVIKLVFERFGKRDQERFAGVLQQLAIAVWPVMKDEAHKLSRPARKIRNQQETSARVPSS